MEERAGERRSVFIRNSPLLGPHSFLMERKKAPGFETVSATPPKLSPAQME
jgi:hypothetical protein